ncbi:signal transduction histidine kinase [Tahibacter aquaticus]|uniref:histidine kinase n=1 Tax=Tahibacter aquaticus TaxID=520092 RepID=A0A4R6Z270_9GAMM|nr:HAMP domain-containing sensor histidine kinase [Tahibacter aquaticus]TDR45673.1 signal transduction histidine kinase [Tahibacter aquaticus]
MNLADWRPSFWLRLAALQALVFLALAALLFAGLYGGMTAYAQNQLHRDVERELAALIAADPAGETPDVERVLRYRGNDDARLGWYALFAPDGKLLKGDFVLPALRAGWHEIPYPDTATPVADQDEHRLLVLAQPLPNGRWLAVGRDTFLLTELEELYAGFFGWMSLLTLVLAVAGGTIVSRRLRRRTDALRSVTEAVGAGELSRRVILTPGNDEFDSIGGHVNEMLDRIEQLMERLRQVSLDVAHDLRTPLSRLRQKLESAQEAAADGSSERDTIAACLTDVDGILSTFGALLRIARIEDGSPRRGFARLDLSEVFTTVVDALVPVAEDAAHLLTADIQPDVFVEGDRDLLTQMLVNVVENAICHTPSGTRIRVSLARQAEGFVAVVQDTGPGIPVGERERIFRPFVRLDGSRTQVGNGLGLALVKAIADVHNATVAVVDNERGTSFRVVLPPSLSSDSEAVHTPLSTAERR